VFANPVAAEEWFKENNPEGAAFEHEVLEWIPAAMMRRPPFLQTRRLHLVFSNYRKRNASWDKPVPPVATGTHRTRTNKERNLGNSGTPAVVSDYQPVWWHRPCIVGRLGSRFFFERRFPMSAQIIQLTTTARFVPQQWRAWRACHSRSSSRTSSSARDPWDHRGSAVPALIRRSLVPAEQVHWWGNASPRRQWTNSPPKRFGQRHPVASLSFGSFAIVPIEPTIP
jgi:hypothetical protein